MYYVSFDVRWSGNYMDAETKNDRYLKRYYIKLEVTGELYGLAGQLEALGGFKWQSVSPELRVKAPAVSGDIETLTVTGGGRDAYALLLTLLSECEELPAMQIQETPEWTQDVRLNDAADGVPMVLRPARDGLYIETEDGSYKLSAPPWLFDRMAAAVCASRILTFDEAVGIARREVLDTHYGEYITPDSAAFGKVQHGDYGYEWVITLVGSDGDEQKNIELTIIANYVGQIDEAD